MADNTTTTPMPWSQVVQSPDYQALGPTEKFEARKQYFDQVVSPQVPEADRASARQEFYHTTQDQSFSEHERILGSDYALLREAADSASFGTFDKLVAAGRSAFSDDLDYDTALAQERAKTQTSQDILGKGGTILADVLGGAATGEGLAGAGLTLAGKGAGLVSRLLYGGVEGAGYGAASGLGHNDSGDLGSKVADTLSGATTGAVTGGLVGGIGGTLAHSLAPTSARLTNAAGEGIGSVNGRAQTMLQDALGGDKGQQTLDQMARMGDDTMALNANPNMRGLAQAIVARPGEASDTIRTAVDAQRSGASDRMLAGTTDALGAMPTVDMAEQIKLAKEAISDNSKEYTPLLSGKTVSEPDRRAIQYAAQDAYDAYGAENTRGTALHKFTTLSNIPEDAVQLNNLKNNLNDIAQSYPDTASHIYSIKQQINQALDRTTGGEFQKLQDVHAQARSRIEAVERAQDFLSNDAVPRDITADMVNNPQYADLMRGVAREAAQKVLTGPGSDISNIQRLVGRNGNAQVRQNIAAIFGQDAADKLTNLAESEVKKNADYGRILAGSKTAETTQGNQSIDHALAGVPDGTPDTLFGLGKAGMRMLLELTNKSSNANARSAIANVATMNQAQLQRLLIELHRANAVQQAVKLGTAAGIGGVVSPAAQMTHRFLVQ